MNDAVRYRVRHETVYSYGGDVAHSHQLLHLTPRNALRQSCHAHSITLLPQPAQLRDVFARIERSVERLAAKSGRQSAELHVA